MIVAHKFLSFSLKSVLVLIPLNVNEGNNALHFEFLLSNTNGSVLLSASNYNTLLSICMTLVVWIS